MTASRSGWTTFKPTICPDGVSFELEARRVRGLTAAGISAQVEQLGQLLESQAGTSDEHDGGVDKS